MLSLRAVVMTGRFCKLPAFAVDTSSTDRLFVFHLSSRWDLMRLIAIKTTTILLGLLPSTVVVCGQTWWWVMGTKFIEAIHSSSTTSASIGLDLLLLVIHSLAIAIAIAIAIAPAGRHNVISYTILGLKTLGYYPIIPRFISFRFFVLAADRRAPTRVITSFLLKSSGICRP